jgi:8-oxo-dGTP pyrophosphatase MutT (NUDIX family)
MKHYVLGFVVNHLDQVALVLKIRGPKHLHGKLNGIGGKVESGETPSEAMSREFHEEADWVIEPHDWTPRGKLTVDDNVTVHVFKHYCHMFELPLRNDVGEQLFWMNLDRIISRTARERYTDNMFALLPLVFSKTTKYFEIHE